MWIKVVSGVVGGIVIGFVLFGPGVAVLRGLIAPDIMLLNERLTKVEQFLQNAVEQGRKSNEVKNAAPTVGNQAPSSK